MAQADTIMDRYYEVMDKAEERRITERAKKQLADIMKEHQKYLTAKEKLEEEEEKAAAAREESKEQKKAGPKITEEKKQELNKLEAMD